jgi:hypothetical protein
MWRGPEPHHLRPQIDKTIVSVFRLMVECDLDGHECFAPKVESSKMHQPGVNRGLGIPRIHLPEAQASEYFTRAFELVKDSRA